MTDIINLVGNIIYERRIIKMKFTDGYWQIRKEISPVFAVEYGYHRIEGNALHVYAPGVHIAGKGDTVSAPVLTVTFTSPSENVIRTEIVHFRGSIRKGPFFEVNETHPNVEITEEEKEIRYRSGRLEAVISREPGAWQVDYLYDGRPLTRSGYRNMAYMSNRQTGKTYITEQLALEADEQIYGLGERFTPFVKNGQIVDMWNEDGGTASEIAYKNIPFYVSSRGYGIFVDDPGDVSFEIASEKVECVQFSTEGESLAYYVIGGNEPKEAVSAYTALTGRPALPPAWTFGLWLTTSFSTDYTEEIVTGFLDGMKARDIPLRVFHFDCFWMHGFEWCNFTWDESVFPDPKAMIDRYHQRGLKICVWINPYIAQNSLLFGEAMENGYLLHRKDGTVWQTDLWQAGTAIVDFTNPAAVKWYQDRLGVLLDLGVDSFKTDFGERIPVRDIAYYDGSDPVKMHNYYSLLYNKTVFELLEQRMGKGEAAVFARAATAGCQQFPVHWGGDCTANYQSMAETLRGGLSAGMSGIGFWSHDISGFEQCATPDLYKRWAAFGLLSSHSRLHGGTSYRVPWLFDEESCDVLRFFTKLKCRLMPYLYEKAVESHETGIPMLRAMVLEYPKDRACRYLDLQYMLGDSLMVVPVFRPDGEVEYYMPEGRWVHLLSGRTEQGGCWKKETYDYMSLPLFVRENHLIIMGNTDDVPDYDYGAQFTVLVPEFEEGAEYRCVLPTVDGGQAAVINAKREGGAITVEVSEKLCWNIRKIGVQPLRIEKDDSRAVIILEKE